MHRVNLLNRLITTVGTVLVRPHKTEFSWQIMDDVRLRTQGPHPVIDLQIPPT